MKNNIIYHIGLTPPPEIDCNTFKICFHPLIEIEFLSPHLKEDLNEILNHDPVLVFMSKNAVRGFEVWLTDQGINISYLNNEFWTVGERTYAYLKDVFNREAYYPSIMTGKGLIRALNEQGRERIILICGNNPQKEFIQNLNKNKINFFHFSVYEVKIKKDINFINNFKNIKMNYIVATSPSSINGFLNNLELNDLSEIQAKIISIGPTTTEAILKSKGKVFFESNKQNITYLYEDLNHVLAENLHN